MNLRTHKAYILVIALTMVAILFNLLFPDLAGSYQLLIAGILVAVVGIPHGATDYAIFKRLVNKELKQQQKVQFFSFYMFLLMGYGVVWYFMPVSALVIFLALSVYHFGQSNWNYLTADTNFGKALKVTSYISWGAFVLAAPICTHIETAQPVIESITQGQVIDLGHPAYQWLPIGLLIFNALLILLFFSTRMLPLQDIFREFLNLILLSLLFWFTPLFLGFAIYFALWHSFGSVLDQINFIKEYSKQFNIKKYYIEATPMTILSFVGMGAIWYVNHLWLGYSIVAVFFIMIAIVTLPHMLLIERLYHNFQKTTAN